MSERMEKLQDEVAAAQQEDKVGSSDGSESASMPLMSYQNHQAEDADCLQNEENPPINISYKRQPGCLPARVTFVLLAFLGTTNLYLMRMNMSEAIVAMVAQHPGVNRTTPKYDTGCPASQYYGQSFHHENITLLEDALIKEHSKIPTFDWDTRIQGFILSAFFYGYLFLQYPGGVLADKYGGKNVLGYSLLISSLLTVLTPWAARWHYVVLIGLRFIQGFVSGCAFPALQSMMAKWIPREELSLAYTLCGGTGTYIGALLGSLLTGIISDDTSLGGWPTTFYLFGASGLVWCLLWLLFTSNDPQEHKHISESELDLILTSRVFDRYEKRFPMPWKHILRPGPLWAAYIMQWGHTVITNFIMVEMPLYMNDILRISISANGIINAIPNVAAIIGSFISGCLADWIIRRKFMSHTNTRKAFSCFGVLTPAVAMAMMTIWPCDIHVVMAIVWTATGLSSFCSSGVYLCFMSMAPQFAGALYGIGNCLATTAGVALPQLVGISTVGAANTVQTWSYIIYVSHGISLLTGVVFLFWGSADVQSWASSKPEVNNVT